MAKLKKFDMLIPMHCGNNVPETAKPEMPGKRVLRTTGSRFTFTA